VRCTYSDYKSVYTKNKKVVKDLDRDLIRRASGFYNSKILGISVSDLIYEPNLALIDDVVLNTIVDLDRIKMYHPVNRPTRYKYAAYIGFWWERIRPLLCKASDYKALLALSQKLKAPGLSANKAFPVVLDISKSINEIFMCDFILDMIRIPPGQTTVCVGSKNKTIVGYNDIKDSLQYFLRYRNYNAQNLELFLKGLNVCPMSIV